MKRWITVVLVCAPLALVSSSAGATGNAKAGDAKAAVCRACHGPDGNSLNPQWPNLAGQSAPYIVKQLQDFKAGRRTNPLMSPQAAKLSEQDMEDLAAYFSSQKEKIGSADPKLVTAGERLYRGGDAATGVPACMACHGPTGAGNPAARYPALHGQHADYVMSQLEAFKDGSRTNDPNKMMREIAGRLTKEQMRAVASYINGLY
ncbi:MAG: cytochrome c4 [Chromatiales bacterium 21-64-14]|nr:MAG: cytochrome c4 [Chromatiales bacterium 21-64-14]HQU14627.1 c-type cytochrome [Gammaproteobacteria bacterium]